MALTGDLRNIGLADLFQTLHQNRATGMLEVVNGASRKKLLFTAVGVTLTSRRTLSGFRMGKRLVGLGKVTAEDTRDALTQQESEGGLLGEILISRGCCTEEDIREVIRYHVEEDLFELFTWTAGTFSFHEGSEPSPEELAGPYAAVSIDPAQAILDAARRIDECERSWGQLPDRHQIIGPNSSSPKPLDPAEWNSHACAIYDLLDGTHTLDEVMEDLFISEYEAIPTIVELMNAGLVRKRTVSELTSTASVLSVREEFPRAILCLKAALIDRPDDPELLNSLCATYEKMGDKSEAAGVLKHLAQLRYGSKDLDAAAKLLTRAARYAPGSADIQEQLAMVLTEGEDQAGAMAAYLSASEILNERGDFSAAADICALGLQLDPDNIRLRNNMANSCLGAGDTEGAIDQLIQLVPFVEADGSRRQIEDLYRRILQLDSSRREYLARLERVTLEGIRKRKRIKALAVAGSSILILATLAIVVMPGGMDSAAMMEQVISLQQSGDLEGAARLCSQIIQDDPESDAAIQARNIQSQIRKSTDDTSPARQAKKELDEALEKIFDIAEIHFTDGLYEQGMAKLTEAVDFLETADTKQKLDEIGKRDARTILSVCQQRTTGMLDTYVEGIGQLLHTAEQRLTELQEGKAKPGEIAQMESALSDSKELLDDTDPTVHERIASQAESAESAICKGSTEKSTVLLKAIDNLRRVNADITKTYHVLNASVLRHQLCESYASVTQEANDLKNRGLLKEARDACAHYLAECDDLRRMRPAGYYSPVADTLLGDDNLNLDGKIAGEMEHIDRVLGDIKLAERDIADGRHAEANALLRSLIRDNFRIDFRQHIRLALWVRTSPTGAEVTIAWNGRDPTSLGRTTEDGILIRYPPLGPTIVEVKKETFEPVRIEIQGFNDDHAAAPLLRLEKRIFWKVEGLGPQQARPLLLHDSIILAGRDGHVRTLARETGETRMDHNHGLLSGFAASPLQVGDVLWLASLDQRLLAFDLKTREIRHDLKCTARLRTSPIRAAEQIVTVDERGLVRAIKRGRDSWSRQLAGRVLSEPAATDRAIFVATSSGDVHALDAHSGEVIWSTEIGRPVHSPVILDPAGRPIVATDNGGVHLLDPGTGKRVWSARLDNATRGTPVIFGNHAWVCTLSGGIYELSLGDGTVTKRLSSLHGIPIENGPVFDKDRFYVVDANGKLASFDLSGRQLWRVDLDTSSATAPVVADERVYVATSEGTVYCFER